MSDQASLLNAAIFEKLAEPSPAAGDAVSNWTRLQMYLPFTRMPRRGFFHQIMSPNTLYTAEQIAAMGERLEDCEKHTFTDPDGVTRTMYSPWYGGGQLLYEVIEGRLQEADFQRRLAARTVPRYTWKIHHRLARSAVRNKDGTPSDYGRRQVRTRVFVDQLVLDIADLAVALSSRSS